MKLFLKLLFLALYYSAQAQSLLMHSTLFNKWSPIAGGAPSAQTPTNLSGANPLFWFVGADYATDYDQGTWPDRWTNGYTLTRDTAFPEHDTANPQSVSWNGIEPPLRNVAYTNSRGMEMVMLINFTNNGSVGCLVTTDDRISPNYSDSIILDGANDRWLIYSHNNYNPVIAASDTPFLATGWLVLSVSYGTNGFTQFCVNGHALTSGTSTTYPYAQMSLYVGADYANNRKIACKIAEIAGYNLGDDVTPLTQSQLNTISNYWWTTYSLP